MTKAIVIHEYGGPDVLQWEDIEVGEPGPDEVRLRHEAMSLNFRDTYHRTGSYKIPGDKFPAIIGGDGSGVIEAVGENVSHVKAGDRVAYGTGPMGSYAQARLIPAEFVVKLPDEISFEDGAAMMVKGLTANYLLRQSYDVKAGETILIQAAAGGVGLFMVQWAKHLGATVIGTVGSNAKAEIAKKYGCDHTINYSEEDFTKRVREITDGVGVPVVYDGVGAATYAGSLDCLAERGFLIGYGNASGNFPMVDPFDLMHKGSLYFQRTSMHNHVRNREELETGANKVMDLVGRGIVKIEIGGEYALKDARQAHIDLEARKTSGNVIYRP